MTVRRGTTRKSRSATVLAALVIGAIAFGLGTAQAREKEAKAKPGLPEQISSLGKKLYGLDIEDAKPVTDEIQKLVVGHLNAWIANRTPSIIEVRHELEQTFSKLEYPALGTPAIFTAPWKSVNLIGAGYTLGWSNIWRINVLVIYENQNGRTREVTTTDFVPRTDMHFAIVVPPPDGAFRFIAYGSRLGMSHPRLSAVLYAFDGKTLASQWKVENLFDGKLNANNDTVVISYVDRDEYIRQTQQGHMPPRHEKTYKATPEGLQLESEHEIPFGT
ncbi:MAG TPA: hypothetical protein VFZ27_10815 [Terriglobia bacterium]|nr:hypothetical protein [Terriglobia bacterium]